MNNIEQRAKEIFEKFGIPTDVTATDTNTLTVAAHSSGVFTLA